VIPNEDLDWENWNRIGMATYAATKGSKAGFAAFDQFSQKSRKYDRANTRDKWRELRKYPPDRIGAGTLFYLASEADPSWRERGIYAALRPCAGSASSDGGDPAHTSCAPAPEPQPTGSSGGNGKTDGKGGAETKATAKPYVAHTLETESLQTPRWLWHGHLLVGALEMTAGTLGIGKGVLACDLIARVTTGRDWPNGSPGTEPGSVIVLTAEDHAADYARRLRAPGADLRKVTVLEYVRREGRNELFLLATDIDKLEVACRDIGDVRLVVIDPITAYMGSGKGFDSHRATDVRSQLHPLKAAAGKLNVAFAAITHPPKHASSRSALDSFIGSQAFIAAARIAHYCVQELGEEDDRGFRRPTGRVLYAMARPPSHSMIMPTLAFRLEIVCVGNDHETGEPVEAPRLIWEPEPVNLTADEALALNRTKAGGDGRKFRAAPVREFLRDMLAHGPIKRSTIVEAGAAEGFSAEQLRRARETIGAVAYRQDKDQFGSPTFWCLPEHVPTDAEPDSDDDDDDDGA
jgi:hypothetical protein